MLTVNNSEHPFREGMTVRTILDDKGIVFHRIIVRVNNKVVEEADYAETFLHDGDDVKALHIFAGG
jgi:sulfur carrier protein